MCTVSFVPTARGFRLAMNRDEKRARVAALPPAVVRLNGHRAIFPREPGVGTWRALKKLHASHLPQRGPFSICMHRPEAATVSYSEVNVSDGRATLRYYPAAPCRAANCITKSIAL